MKLFTWFGFGRKREEPPPPKPRIPALILTTPPPHFVLDPIVVRMDDELDTITNTLTDTRNLPPEKRTELYHRYDTLISQMVERFVARSENPNFEKDMLSGSL